MARNINGGTDRIAYDGTALPAITSGTPVALAFRMRTTQATAAVQLAARWSNISRLGFALVLTNTGTIQVQAWTTTGLAFAFTTVTSVNDGNWHSILATISPQLGGTTTLYIDGVSAGTGNNGANGWTSTSHLVFGDSLDPFWASYIGNIADVGYWHNIGPGADHAAAYASGMSARLLRPEGLELYAPMVRDHQCKMGIPIASSGFSGTTVVDHPRVIGSLV